MACHKFRIILCTTKSKHNPSLSLLILLGKSKPIFEVGKLIGAAISRFCHFSKFSSSERFGIVRFS
jgi:hypothetical protein